MVTNSTYKNYIKQIAVLYCNNNELCKAGIEARLTNNFDNNSIQTFISQLNSRQFYSGYFELPMRYVQQNNKYYSGFTFENLLTGVIGMVAVEISPEVYNPNNTDWKKVIESINKPFLRFSHITGNKIIFASSEHSGYGISFVPTAPGTNNPVQTGTGTNGSTNVNQPGTVQVQTSGGAAVVNPQTGQVVATSNFKVSDFDFNKLIIPGLIIAAVLIAKQMKLF
jgi:hypothetical protein